MFIFGKNNNHLIKNNYKTTFSLPQKIRLIQKQIIQCACGYDFIICLAKDLKPYCYFQSAVYNIDFKTDTKIIDIATQQNLILFVTQKGELYGTQFISENIINDSLKPQIIKLNLNLFGLKQKKVKQVKMTGGLIFLKMQNNIILELKRNDWMQTKTFSDPQIVHVSKNQNISQIACSKNIVYFMTYDGNLFASNKNQISSHSNRIEIKQKLKKIVGNQKQLFGINEAGLIVKIHTKNNKAKIQKTFKIAATFIDLILGNQNYYAITQDREAWVWGKNSCGQLGLSDYEHRLSLYPLVSLQRFYIKQFFAGENYVCCLVDQTKIRQTVKMSQRSSSVCSMREVHTLFAKNNQFHECRDSFNQAQQFLMPIRYTQDESKISSYTDQNESCAQVNIIVNKKNNKPENLSKKCIVNEKQASSYLCKRSSHRQKVESKVQNKKTSLNQHNRSKSKSVISKQSKSRLTPKSMNRQKSLFKNKKQQQKQHNALTESDIKSNGRSYKKQKFVTQKNIKKQNKQKENELKQRIEKQIRQKMQNQIKQRIERQIRQMRQKICKQYEYKLVDQLKQRQKKQDERVNIIKLSHQNQRQDLKDKVYRLQSLLNSKTQQSKDLFELISHKNITIQDITSKIKLLQQAIQQHEKILTQRDNEAQQYYIRQKQYQLHITKLQSQIQQMMDVLNYNQKNKQSLIYKQQIQRLSSQIKSKLSNQKQYYQSKIQYIENKFCQQRNIYQIEIKNLQSQLNFYKNKQQDMIKRLKQQQDQFKKIQANKIQSNKLQNTKIQSNKLPSNKKQVNKIQTSLQLQGNYNQNNYSHCMQSPTFHNLDIKNNLKQKLYQKIQQNQSMKQSQLTLNQIQQKLTIPLKQSNRQNVFINHLQKNNYDLITKKNSRIYNININSQNNYQLDNQNLYYSTNNKSQSQVKQILYQIQQNKTNISKSANKLFNLLENDKIQKHSK